MEIIKTSKISILFVLCCMFSCKKAEDRNCFKSIGELGSRVVDITEDVDTLFLYDDLYYSLSNSEDTKVRIEGGANLLNHVEVVFESGKMTIRNGNKCNFLRSYDHKIKVKIDLESISYIHYEGSRELLSEDTLVSDELRLVIRDGAGSTNLKLKNGYTSATVSHGFGDFTLAGETTYAYLHCNSNSYCDTRNFKATNSLNVYSNTVAKMLVNAQNTNFVATINNSGNIEYVGTPLSDTYHFYGSGEVVSLNN